MAPCAVTVGVKSSFTPKGLNCTVTTGAVAPPVGVVVMVGNGKRSAGQEAGVLAFQHDQVRLGQNLQQVALLQRLDGGADD